LPVLHLFLLRKLSTKLPANLFNGVSYSRNIKAIAVLLSTEGLVARERLSLFFAQITQGVLRPTEAALGGFFKQMSAALASELEVINTALLNGKVMGTDETPMCCSESWDYGKDKTAAPVLKTASKGTFKITVRTYSNEIATFLTANPQKDIAGIERDGILPVFHGILSHDHDKKFYNYGTDHATCGEHLTRDLRGPIRLWWFPCLDLDDGYRCLLFLWH